MIELFEQVDSKFASLDILVNNAGVGIGGSIDELKFETWRKVMSVNLDGAFCVLARPLKS